MNISKYRILLHVVVLAVQKKSTGSMFSQTGFYTLAWGCPFILLVCFELKSISLTDPWPVVENTEPNSNELLWPSSFPLSLSPCTWLDERNMGCYGLKSHVDKGLVLLSFWELIHYYLVVACGIMTTSSQLETENVSQWWYEVCRHTSAVIVLG